MKISTALLAFALGSAGAANAATIVSEDFSTGFGQFQVSGRVNISHGDIYTPCCGVDSNKRDNFAAFGGGGDPSGILSYTFRTQVGSTYRGFFDYTVLGQFGEPELVTVRVLDNVGISLLVPMDNSLTFRQAALEFVARDSTSTIQFFSGGAANSDAILDNVVITGAAVPEPAVWGMMIAGLGATGYAMRRRRRVAVAA